jgi:hypothetical protein
MLRKSNFSLSVALFFMHRNIRRLGLEESLCGCRRIGAFVVAKRSWDFMLVLAMLAATFRMRAPPRGETSQLL